MALRDIPQIVAIKVEFFLDAGARGRYYINWWENILLFRSWGPFPGKYWFSL